MMILSARLSSSVLVYGWKGIDIVTGTWSAHFQRYWNEILSRVSQPDFTWVA